MKQNLRERAIKRVTVKRVWKLISSNQVYCKAPDTIINTTRQRSSMIYSAISTDTPIANSVSLCFVLLDFEKWGRTYGRHVQNQ